MSLPKPASHISWTDGAPAKVQEPTGGKKLLGWAFQERPPFEFMNWLFFRLDEWVKYFESVTDELSIQKQEYDAIVGVGGTHATFNDLMADPLIATKKNILVSTALTLTANQVINQNDMTFVFKPQAIITKGGGCTIGLDITGLRCKVIRGRFVSFNVAGDIAIRLAVASKNCLVSQCNFLDNLTEVSDLGTGNAQSGNISEVV